MIPELIGPLLWCPACESFIIRVVGAGTDHRGRVTWMNKGWCLTVPGLASEAHQAVFRLGGEEALTALFNGDGPRFA